MPNKTIYIADEDMPVFQKAQEVAGESVSKVIIQALRQYILQKDLEETELKECEAMKGTHGSGMNVQKARFIGKWLSKITVGSEYGESETTYNLYFTRRGKFVLQIRTEYRPEIDMPIEYDYHIIEDFNKLYTWNLPSKLIKDAEEQLGKSHIRFLDI